MRWGSSLVHLHMGATVLIVGQIPEEFFTIFFFFFLWIVYKMQNWIYTANDMLVVALWQS